MPAALAPVSATAAALAKKQLAAGAAQTLRTKLAQLHAQILALPGSDPNRWHTLLDDYAQTTAALYVTLTGSN